MPDLDQMAREIADDTFSATHVPEMHRRLHVVILAALREECARIAEAQVAREPRIAAGRACYTIADAIRTSKGR